MLNIKKHIEYWRKGAEEDLLVGKQIIKNGYVRHGLFFIHLALEKLLKALICKQSQDLPPKIHNLSRLVELLNIDLTTAQHDFLASMNAFNIEGRYPVPQIPIPTVSEARSRILIAEEVVQWLINQL